MSDNKLNVIDLHKRYGEHEVLKGVSLQAKAGDVISIIGFIGFRKKYLFCAVLTSLKNRAKARSSSAAKILAWYGIKTAS
ncbi:Histidine ABC transporter [Klebsiella pneumoniae subsp. ozaenae]|uniref:Histidine ABC transporter n=1 Tax=Klebsiella pneumoniae subsp. ozaenae TaxID=574 RepID=A0A377Z9D5_KLEPO|nr:Histidine ABC transporter [Klebsiella pneumoniae subsp. ozaenae]